MAERNELSDVDEPAWRAEVLCTLKGMQALLAQLVDRVEIAEKHEPSAAYTESAARTEGGAATNELSVDAEPLPTWILTDGAVAAIERAILQEQRVRGSAYGG